MAARLKEGVPVDWQDIVSRFTMDSATEFLFGKDVRSLDAPIPYPSTYHRANAPHQSNASGVHPADRFVQAFQQGLEATAIRGRFLQSWPLFEFWGDKVEGHMKTIDAFIEPLLQEALRRKAEKEKDDGSAKVVDEDNDNETLLDHLVKLTDGKIWLRSHCLLMHSDGLSDPQIIRDETLNILLAGRDTVCNVLLS